MTPSVLLNYWTDCLIEIECFNGKIELQEHKRRTKGLSHWKDTTENRTKKKMKETFPFVV